MLNHMSEELIFATVSTLPVKQMYSMPSQTTIKTHQSEEIQTIYPWMFTTIQED